MDDDLLEELKEVRKLGIIGARLIYRSHNGTYGARLTKIINTVTPSDLVPDILDHPLVEADDAFLEQVEQQPLDAFNRFVCWRQPLCTVRDPIVGNPELRITGATEYSLNFVRICLRLRKNIPCENT